MKKLMMRTLLLVTALGYFLAAVHTHGRGAGHTYCIVDAAAQHQHSDGSGDQTHDCPICTVQSHTAALLPPYNARPLVIALPDAPFEAAFASAPFSPTICVTARAPPSA